MTIKVGINGFGRIGRLALRAAWGWPELEFVQVNDPAGDAATHAHLLNFDSVHGRWQHEASHAGECIVIGGKSIKVTANKAIADTDWSGCDLVIEASGKMKTVAVLPGLSRSGREARSGQRPGERGRRIECGDGGQPGPVRPCGAPHRHRRLLHHQLPGASGQSDPRTPGHSPRIDHHHSRPDQHPEHPRPAAQGPASRSGFGHEPDPDQHRLGHRDCRDIPGAARQTEWPRRACAAGQRLADRLRFRG